MSRTAKDRDRVMKAAQAILDGRHPVNDMANVLITLDHTIATVLIAAMDQNAKNAVTMLHEGTIPHVEERIMLFENRRKP